MDYDKYRMIEQDIDTQTIADTEAQIVALDEERRQLKDRIDQIEQEKNSWRSSLRKLRSEAAGRAYEVFKIDALEEAGLTDHPKADQLFQAAWDKGHSGGYCEVMEELDNLVELFNGY